LLLGSLKYKFTRKSENPPNSYGYCYVFGILSSIGHVPGFDGSPIPYRDVMRPVQDEV